MRRILIASVVMGAIALVAYPLADPNFDPSTDVPGAIFIGFASTFAILAFEGFAAKRTLKRLPQLPALLLSTALDVTFITAVIAVAVPLFGLAKENNEGFVAMLYRADFQAGLALMLLGAFVVRFLQLISTLVGPGTLIKVLAGRYHRPREEDRILLFIDLSGSTRVAEAIGHLKFLSFLNDFFQDVSEAVRAAKGEIHKYVGDEAIISWTYRAGSKNSRALSCVFQVRANTERRRAYYSKRYGMLPEFKAALHCGTLAVGEMGSHRKEIAYLGDVINTAARLEGMAGECPNAFAVSGEVVALVPPGPYLYEFVTKATLRGKERPVEVYTASPSREA